MKKTQITRYQYINGMAKKTTKWEPDSHFIKAGLPEVIATERLARIKMILAARASGDRKAALDASRSAKAGWAVAYSRKRYFENGANAYWSVTSKDGKTSVKYISPRKFLKMNNKQKKAQGVEKTFHDGRGVNLEMQKVYEMFLAARAAFLTGYHNPLSGKDFGPGIKAASSAASNEIRRALQMPFFDSIAKAERFSDKTREILRRELAESQDIECQEDVDMVRPEGALLESSMQDFDVERLGDSAWRRRRLADCLWNARKRVISYWKSTNNRKWKSCWKNDSRLLREIVASALEGRLFAGSHDSSRRKHLRDLAKRIGNTLIASDLQDITRDSEPEFSAPQTVVKQDVMEIPTPKIKVLAYTEVPVNNILGQTIRMNRTSIRIA